MTKLELFNKEYNELKERGTQLECVILSIHMPTGEIETITNPNIEEKVKYINKVYDENLVHSNCKDICIEDYLFVEKNDSFDFGWAVAMLKDGYKLARRGWNGKGMFVYYVPENTYKANTEVAKKEFGEEVKYNPYFAIKNVNGTVSTWVPSVNDCLAEDWEVVE